ncbi:biosynthesis C-methyltransferase UbiE (Partial), partial [Seminavis robusta]|eukprot:Sro389_g132470.1 biosynthesis C-methyltransferase UbiE (254) ;mRNA; r:2-764
MTTNDSEAMELKADDNNEVALEALQVEYSAMASWYDSFWADYLNKTFVWPLRLVSSFILDRTRKQQENDESNSKKPITVVDVACGTGEFVKRLQSLQEEEEDTSVRFVGVEPCPEMLERAKRKQRPAAQWIQATAESLPLDDASADIICSTNAFHFFRNKPLALAQMYRVLRRDSGRLVITDWCADALTVRWYHLFEWVRWNLFGRFRHQYPGPLRATVLQQLVEEAGFQNVTVESYQVRFWTFVPWGMQTVTA